MRARLDAAFGLLAYEEPSSKACPQAPLLTHSRREEVADALNGAILAESGAPRVCAVERLVQQLVASRGALREANDGYGDCVRVGLTSDRDALTGCDSGGEVGG